MTAPDELAREKISEDKQIEIERADAQNLGYGFADGRKDIILRCPICGTPTRSMPK
jgi:predicted Zn-ribbon and HTH transcriptional regulator